MILDEVKPFQEQIVAMIAESYWRAALSARYDDDQTRMECLYQYQVKFPPKTSIRGNRSRRKFPSAFHTAQTIIAELKAQTMPRRDWFQILETDYEDAAYAEHIAVELLFRLKEMRFEESIRGLWTQCGVIGVCPYETGWMRNVTPVTRGLRNTAAPGAREVARQETQGQARVFSMVPVREDRVLYDGLHLQLHDHFNCVSDPAPMAGMRPQDTWREKRIWQTLSQLRSANANMPGGYQLFENLDKIDPHREERTRWDDTYVERLEALNLNPMAVDPRAGVPLIEHQGPFWMEIEGELRTWENVIIVTAQDQTLLRFEDNPRPNGRLPLQFATYQEPGVPRDLQGGNKGIGFIQPGLGILSIYDATANQFVDLSSRMLKGQHTVLAGDHIFDAQDAEVAADTFIKVTSHETLKPLEHEIRLFNLVELIGLWRNLWQDASGAPENMTTEQYQKSATEIAQIATRVDTRFRELARHLEVEVLEPMLEDMIGLIGMHWSPTQQQPVMRPDNRPGAAGIAGEESSYKLKGQKSATGRVWVEVDPAAFTKRFSVEAMGSNIAMQRHERLMGLQMVAELAVKIGAVDPSVPQNIDWRMVMEEVFDLAVGHNVDRLWRPVSPALEMLRRLDASAAAGAQGAIPGGPGGGGGTPLAGRILQLSSAG